MIANQCLIITMKKLIFVAFLVLLNSIVTHQQESCLLPGGRQQSICVREQRCDYFQNIIRKYNGKPPPDVISNIRSHSCKVGKVNGLCCPDNAVDGATPDTPYTPPLPQDLRTQNPNQIDFNAIKYHRNINFINERTCGSITSNRIVGGVNAGLREFPWAALLGYELPNGLVWQCGGTLISQKIVLTACHCITKDLVLVRLGEHVISKPRDCDDSDQCADPVQDIMIEKKIKHPRFTRATKENDLALLKLVRPADTSRNNVKTICLPISPESDIEEIKKSRLNLVVTGWGRTGNALSSDILQKAFVPFIDSRTCNAIFNPKGIQIYPTQLCAGYSETSMHDKTDSCKGDSGGGLMAFYVYNEKPKALLYGVVTGGVNCEDPNKIYPGIYVNIKYFFTWILDNIS